VYKAELLQAFNDVGKFYGDCESCFQKYTARRLLLVQYVYISLTSSCCKMFWKHTAHT